MSDIKLKIYPAQNGDSFLLSAGNTYLLIDGGYVNTYENFILRDLKSLADAGEALSHVIVTHMDQDHISGLLKLFEQNKAEDFIGIGNVWHNSYRHINPEQEEEKAIVKNEELEEIKGGAYLKKVSSDEETPIGAIQGSSLAAFLLEGKYPWNAEFGGRAVATDNGQHILLTEDIRLTLLSPNIEKLRKLERAWRKELIKKGYLNGLSETGYYDDAFEFMVAKHRERPRYREKKIAKATPDIANLASQSFLEDTTAANGSSMAFIIEYKTIKLLFLGDAHPGIVAENLKSLYKPEDFPVRFDLIKTSHHGSWANNSPELYSLIDSPSYVFSTNGLGHNHPDDETIAHIVSRKSEYTRKLFFNYPLEKAKAFDESSLREEYNYEIIQADGETPLEISF
ncbi:AVAST type 1 anti-phage system MBL fold metallo-hydrolase Avs1a [Roseivirga seohaensis]|uniref:AVAST type 1 anti-phage system MBL fold metallo-hydrolase Avs1a n=1 Tax=Roseivirga seohaensis TaxID=1914963 RepID=UPI00069F9A40|nr:AVAST type 1 anti-phage system MBL fold metallo-hydrolase Avs1a [Roseivirga seohaensis]